MKFCKNCGSQLEDAAAFCTQCGAVCEQQAPQQQAYANPQQQNYQQGYVDPQQQAYQQGYADPQQQAYQQGYQQGYVDPQQAYQYQQPYAPQPAPRQSGLVTATKILMVLGTIVNAFYVIPLAWCIPMTISYFNKVKTGQPISTGFKVCSLLFVSLLGGILMLCDKD